MIGVGDLEKIIRIAIYSGRLEGERPLSLLIIAAVGAGKTELVSRFSERYVGSVLYATDITAFALHRRHGKELKRGSIRHIIIPDLLTPLNKQKEQAEHFITFMNGIIEEGIARVESRDSNFSVNVPVKCGFITTLAKKELDRRRDRWASVGFLSRMLPISYSYKQKTVEEILDHIVNREYLQDNPQFINLPPETYIFLPPDLSEQIKPYAKMTKDQNDKYGFRRLKQLQTFVMSSALSAGRNTVEERDLDILDKYVRYINYDCSAEL